MLESHPLPVAAGSSRRLRRAATGLAVLGLATAVAACGNTDSTAPAPSSEPASPATSAPAATPAAAGYDLSRIEAIKADFPAGFTTTAEPTKTLAQQDIDSSGIGAFIEAQVDPPQCRALVIPPNVEPSVGTQAAGVLGDSDQGKIYAVVMALPEPVPANALPAECNRVTLTGGAEAAGTAEAIPAPAIAGMRTTGVRLDPADVDEPDYIYTAALDDRTSVVVMGSTDAQLNPQQLLSDLLVKAATAVKGG